MSVKSTPRHRPDRGPRSAVLRCRTNYSFLEGASHPEELVHRAAELELGALAITDRNSLAGVVRAHVAAKDVGLKLLIGAEITPEDAPPVVLLATDRAGYARLSLLITQGRRRADKGTCELCFDDVTRHADGLLACVPLTYYLSHHLTGRSPLENVWSADTLQWYRECFGDRCYGLAELHHGPDDQLALEAMARLAEQNQLSLAASNDVYCHVAERQPLQDVLTAIRHGCTVTELGHRRFPNAERHLKSSAAMQQLFRNRPDAVHRTMEIADRCTFSLDELRYEYPEELCPQGQTPFAALHQRTWEGARQRYPDGVPDKVTEQIEHEFRLIREMRYEAYFLTVWDLVRFARSQGILCQGRGSAANSTVCYCLGVTEVNPDQFETLFERFISKERNEPPDIDIDFEHERREEVIQYIYDKYGRDRAGMTAVVTTYRLRSAIRDVGKTLGFSIDRINQLSRLTDHTIPSESLSDWMQQAGLDPNARRSRQFLELVTTIRHFPRHLSQHVGGMVFTRGKLSELVPIENASMPGRTVVQWNKDDLDALGILKVDCLSLGMLTAIRKCFDFINAGRPAAGAGLRPETLRCRNGESPDPLMRPSATFSSAEEKDGSVGVTDTTPLSLATIPREDDAVYEMIQKADTVGVFQIESRAQMSMLSRLKPSCFYDLVIEIAIVRPGPIQGDMVHPYLQRKQGLEETTYPDERIKNVLKRTLGVPIFQEQAMQLAVVAAGFTPGEADQLRRAMGTWRKQGVIDGFHRRFIAGVQANGYERDFAERVFRQIQGFGEYGFPESHSASFALLAYASAWLKCHHPAAFTAALLNSQPMGFYAPSQLIADARRHDVEVRPVDVTHSEWDCTLEYDGDQKPALRLGLRMISGLPEKVAGDIVRIRALQAYQSFDDFRQRTRLDAGTLTRLSRADVFASLKLSRRPALWESLPEQREQPLYKTEQPQETPTALPEMSDFSQIIADYQATGLSLKGHPLESFRDQFWSQGIVPAASLKMYPADHKVRIAGIVLNRQHPGTANGITFMTLEDETGTANLVVHPNVWKRFRLIARTATALIARGLLQKESDVIHVIVDHFDDCSATLSGARYQSRDFR